MIDKYEWTEKDKWDEIVNELEDAFYPLFKIKKRYHVDDERFHKLIHHIYQLKHLHDDIYESELKE